MHTDDWISSHSPIEAEKLHALGCITFYWNASEVSLFWLFCTTSGLNGQVARLMIHDISLSSVCLKIKAFADNRDFTPEARDHIVHAVALFDANRKNRNQLTHFLPSGGPDGIEFWRNRGAKIERNVVPSGVRDLRRVADEISSLNKYLAAVGNYLSALHYNATLPTLPDKPPLPASLS